MTVALPVTTSFVTCPKCKMGRLFVNVNEVDQYRCTGCEWVYTFSTKAPTATTNAGRAKGDATLPVASGGASFTAGMILFIGTAAATAEVAQVTATGSATSIPVTALNKDHLTGTTFGQLSIAPAYGATQAIPGG
jgi:rubredoxin